VFVLFCSLSVVEVFVELHSQQVKGVFSLKHFLVENNRSQEVTVSPPELVIITFEDH